MYIYVKVLVAQSCLTLLTPWTIACQAPLSMGFSREGYWSGLPFPSPDNLPNPEIKPGSPASQADILPSESPGKPLCIYIYIYIFHVYTSSYKRLSRLSVLLMP